MKEGKRWGSTVEKNMIKKKKNHDRERGFCNWKENINRKDTDIILEVLGVVEDSIL